MRVQKTKSIVYNEMDNDELHSDHSRGNLSREERGLAQCFTHRIPDLEREMAPGSRPQASQVHIVRPVKKNDNRKRENELTYSKHLLFAGCFTHLEVSSKTRWLPLASYALAISTGLVRKRICPRGVVKALPLGISQDTFLWNFSRLLHMFSSQMEFLN